MTPVDGCGTIEEPGRYVLTRNITNNLGTRTSQNCLWINASDVVLEGAGHRIDGIGVTDSIGIYVGSPKSTENVTVRNLTVSDWHKGVWHRGVRGGVLRNVTASDNAIGLGIENATDTRVIDNAASENLIGIRVTRSSLAALSGNTFENNHGAGLYDELTAVDLLGQRIVVGPPLDPDGDGRYEDVTGDREVGLYDALSLFGVVSAEAVGVGDLHADQHEILDLDGDGDLDYGDVWTLL
jgi:parallel beta-helix repeat protein